MIQITACTILAYIFFINPLIGALVICGSCIVFLIYDAYFTWDEMISPVKEMQQRKKDRKIDLIIKQWESKK